MADTIFSNLLSMANTIFGFQKLHKTSSLNSPIIASPITHNTHNNIPEKHTLLLLPKLKQNSIPLQINSKPKPSSSSHQKIDPQIKALESIIGGLESKRTGIADETFVFVIDKCYELDAIDFVIRTHRLIPDHLLRGDVDLSSKLVKIYSKFGHIKEAYQVFDLMPENNFLSALLWNFRISECLRLRLYENAVAFYFQMVEHGVEPDDGTFPLVLKACAGFGLVQIGEQVHSRIIRQGLVKEELVLYGLVDMYAKCGDIVKARKVFDKMDSKSLELWTSMLTAYMKLELLADALCIFRGMILDGHEPAGRGFISWILAFGLPLRLAAQIHGWVLRRGAEWHMQTATALVGVYSKNGRLDASRWLFDHMPERDLISWTSIISAHHKLPEALLYFKQMEGHNMLPDAVTFVSLLSTCAHLGMVKDGERLFSLMTEKYGITPCKEHYGCMVNLYGRAGLINKAYELIMDRTVFEVDEITWGALLYACSLHNNVEIGEKAAERLFDLEPDGKNNFVLLMEIYSNSGHLEDVKRVRRMMLDRGFNL